MSRLSLNPHMVKVSQVNKNRDSYLIQLSICSGHPSDRAIVLTYKKKKIIRYFLYFISVANRHVPFAILRITGNGKVEKIL